MGAILTRNRESRDDEYLSILRSIVMIQWRNVCSKCDICFKTRMDLNKHMQEDHAEASYTCDYCSLICETWRTFQRHIYVFHSDLVFCSYCYKAFRDYPSLVLHWKIHEPYKCKICNDTFVTRSGLREHHVTLHRNVPFQQSLWRFFQRFIR